MSQKANQPIILATVGPASIERPVLERMDTAGVDIFRINLSHTRAEDFKSVYKKIQQGTKKIICVDSEGAQIRTGAFKDGHVILKKHEEVLLVGPEKKGGQKQIPLYPLHPANMFEVGDILSLDFNRAIVQISSIKGKTVKAEVLEGGQVGSNKGVSVNRTIDLPAFTAKDLKIFKMAAKQKATHVALSFASKKEDVVALRKLFPYPIMVISKIESRSGLAHLEDIAKASDALLIDRGDLSRDVPLQKIGLAQKHILETAEKLHKPVYVATNLLETMMKHFQPTRAEINDITNTLLGGAQGLVLAAETAIGSYPVESVKMAKGIIEEVARYGDKEKYIESLCSSRLIEPHGGHLVQQFISKEKIKNFVKLAKARVPETALMDVVQIAEGVYSPLEGFMDFKQLTSVLDNYKLPSGVVWTLPIILQFHKDEITFKKGQSILLAGPKGNEVYGLMEVSEIKQLPMEEVAKKWFTTVDQAHPGVKKFMEGGDFLVAGKVWLIKKPPFFEKHIHATPRQTREIFRNYGWQKIVGFHTRNVIHRGHEHIQKEALRQVGADALFISPVIGPKKKNDFMPKPIMEAYNIMVRQGYYSPYGAVIGPFATYSRYSGPREAVFTALCRKNFGCSHFIIGRDHTGVGNFYAPNASQEIFAKVGDIGIQPLMFDEAYYCKACGGATVACNHPENQRTKISGTLARTSLIENKEIPSNLMRPEISEMLKALHGNPKEQLFETGQS